MLAVLVRAIETQLELARQVAALTRLHALASRLAQMDELAPKLLEILTAAAEVHNTSCGLLSVHDPATGTLEVAASLNFSANALEAVRDITGGHAIASSAFTSSQRTIVEDTETDPRFVGYRLIARGVGFRAVHSTPIFTRSGALLGVLSLHCTEAGRPTPLQIQLADMCALHAADAIEATRDRERFHDLADNISQLAWIADERGAMTWFNQRWIDYTGAAVEDGLGFGWVTLHHPDHVARVLARWQQAWTTGEAWEDTYPLRGSDGVFRWFLSRARPIRDASGRVVRWFGTNTDITEDRDIALALAEAKAHAEAASEAKDRFLAALSHELRTPLSPILLCAAALELSPELPEVLRDRVAMIRRNVELETKLIDDLLDLSHITSGKLVLSLESVAVGATIADVLEICHTQLEAKAITVTVTLDRDGVIRADPARLRQILWNVVKNAAKFTPTGGTIAIHALVTAHTAVITVTDSGIGIASEALGRVFEAFEQADARITRQFGGLGLGLAISRAIAALHGGTISAASPGAGLGTTFTLVLPQLVAPISDEPTISPAPDIVGTRRLLLVDDHADTVEILGALLAQRGYEVEIAGTVAAALARATAEPFDLLISDVGLPDATGYDLMRQVRALQPMKGIAMSGWGRDGDIARGLAAGFAEHLVKPIALDVLVEAIRRVLAVPD